MAGGRDYERQGDPFTLTVKRGEGPPCVLRCHRENTERDYFTRVPVHLCAPLRAQDVAGMVRGAGDQLPGLHGLPVAVLAGRVALDWHPFRQTVRLSPVDVPREFWAEVRVGVQVTPTGPGGEGARVWLTCPKCERRCGVVYACPWDAQGERVPGVVVTGCRACLGLTDANRQRHKCLDWAGAVLGELVHGEKVREPYRRRGERTLERAYNIVDASFGRMFRGLGVMPSRERGTVPGSKKIRGQ